ncbi:MAG: hypothetical protein LBQ54_14270 [Planctomycetaceae bacterium]|jgi:hypothetical protein|nr:hypothetical protein [Planctomycetaceae bacterium]
MNGLSIARILTRLQKKCFNTFLGSVLLFGTAGYHAVEAASPYHVLPAREYQFSDVVPLYGKDVTILGNDPAVMQHMDLFIYDTQNHFVASSVDSMQPPAPLRLQDNNRRDNIQQVHGEKGQTWQISEQEQLPHLVPLNPVDTVNATNSIVIQQSGNQPLPNPVTAVTVSDIPKTEIPTASSVAASAPYREVAPPVPNIPMTFTAVRLDTPAATPIPAPPKQENKTLIADETVSIVPELENLHSVSYVTRDEVEEILRQYQPLAGNEEADGLRKGRFTFTPYGYINISTSYETQRTMNGDYALYSRSPDLDGGGHSGFHVDPKSSRLGLKIAGPDFNWCCRSIKTGALFEVDFQGNINSTRNRPGLLFRRGFLDFSTPNTRLLIGQEWEVISPLIPQSLSYVPGSCTGNLGYRRAQIRLERTRNWTHDFSTITQLALCDNVPDVIDGVGLNTANAGWPMVQGRIAASFWKNPAINNKPVTLGLSGHIGEMRYDYDYSTYSIDHQKQETWSANLDLEAPVTRKLTFSSELYTGANLASSLGGINQGIDLYSRQGGAFDPRAAKAVGGWANLTYKMTKKFQLNGGYAIEDMPDMIASAHRGGDNFTARTRNQIIYLNGVYNWTDGFMTGLEVSQWKTDWQNYNSTPGIISPLEPGKTTRIDLLIRYTF